MCVHQTKPIFLARKSGLLLSFESVSIIRGKKEVVIICRQPAIMVVASRSQPINQQRKQESSVETQNDATHAHVLGIDVATRGSGGCYAPPTRRHAQRRSTWFACTCKCMF